MGMGGWLNNRSCVGEPRAERLGLSCPIHPSLAPVGLRFPSALQQADVFARECAASLNFKTVQRTGTKAGSLAAAPTASRTQAADPAAAGEAAAEPAAPNGADTVPGGTPEANGATQAAAHANAAQPAAAAAAGPASGAGGAATPAAQAVRNVTHREFVNLCHNWQKVGGQRRAHHFIH